MKLLNTRFIAWMLTLALVATLLPLTPAKSADAASAYFQFDDFSTDVNSPSDVNSNVIDINGTFNSVAQSTLTYKIEKLVKSTSGSTTTYSVAESSVGTTAPIITGSSSFKFAAVSIYDGLNRITVSGANTSGNIVDGTAYVNFTNVPVISEIKMIDGTTLPEGTSIVTVNPTATISLKAPNATEVTINGTQMFGGSGSSFVLSGIALNHGLNTLTVIAKNGSKTYQLTRTIVYYNSTLTAYNVQLGSIPLDGHPTISAAVSSEKLSGKVVMPITGAAPTNPQFTVELWETSKLGTVVTPLPTSTATGTLLESTSTYATYSFTTNGGFSLSSNNEYTFKIIGPSASIVDLVPFTYLAANSPFITGVKQAYSVTESGSTVSYTSSANFSDNATISQLPLWLVLETTNFPSGTTTVSVEQNGVSVASVISATYRTSGTNYPAIKISNLPAGQLKLTFKITDASSRTYSVVRNVTYYPAPAIQIDNLYSGQTFGSSAEFQSMSIVGRLLNFNLANAAELASVKVTLNGVTANVNSLGTINTSNGGFTLTPSTLTLVAGANTITFTGTAGGIPISTSLTIYLFSKEAPVITNVHPVQYVLPPLNDSTTTPLRKFTDSAVKFPVTDDNEYTTTEKSFDLLFKVVEFDSIEVQLDGNKVAAGSVSGTTLTLADPVTTDSIVAYIDKDALTKPVYAYTLGGGEKEFQIRLSEIKLPTSGSVNLTITLRKGTNSVSQTITVVRDLSPYLVLSPKLPNESVINANFMNISIKAEGADQVLIGKIAMTKGEGDIFRYEMQNMKAGKNTVKFTVVTGTQKVNGSFDVTYAADDSISAQYKASIAASGKISIFTGDLQLAFPKNTFLRQANASPGQDVKTVDLFNSQTIYFGIADRTDGRTVKKYNAVGETDSSGNYLDGTIKSIAADSYATDRLRAKTNFSYASDLYWIDAGYFDNTVTPSGDYNLISAMQPYQTGSMFYGRVYEPAKWLEPSQRGTITIKYDTNISNAYGQNLSVWRYTSNGWENIGGVVNTSNKTVTAPFDGFGYYTVMGLRYSFSDIIGHKYARLALESIFAHGIMNNKDANSFGVYENITRGEFAQMLVKVMGIPLQYDPNNMTFDDVQPFDYPDQPYWNYRYVETAVKKGYIRGKSPRLFMPNDNLTRGEAAVMIARALNLVKSNADATKDLASLQKIFTDASTTDTYAVSSILAVNKAGFISGIANTVASGGKATFRYEPDSNLSRADAAVIAQRVMKKLKKL
ncbi:S-layer homology domain-containing protein [Cohnella sp. GbtcB17]|uniref:S-layer homology domain-containing protein n=1 Tax=Cohnella sp. GbtcB17 TaxID=2824762 RepID=UPI001C30F5B9|nr:S-layer homology domain-containing protein [Cohnella sp. GbtcB17]